MKKLNYLLVTLLTMLLVVGCSNEEQLPINDGDEVLVAFNLELPADGLQTRAIGDGTKVNELVYAIYEVTGEEDNLKYTIRGENETAEVTNGKATVGFNVLKGKKYKAVFWAQVKDGNYYTTTNLDAVEVDYTGANNDEDRDAFFNSHDFTVIGDASIDVTLYRPFAQINVGANDYEEAKGLGFEVKTSGVKITNVPNQINLLTGELVDGEVQETVTYTPTEIPGGNLTVDGSDNYEYLSMSYILVGEKKSTLDALEFEFVSEDNGSIKLSQGLTSVPVQRNYRTNIIGRLLTDNVDFNITIDPGFEKPDYEVLYNEETFLNALNEEFNDGFEGAGISMNGKDIEVLFDPADVDDIIGSITAVYVGIMEVAQNVSGEEVRLLVEGHKPFAFIPGEAPNDDELLRLGMVALGVNDQSNLGDVIAEFLSGQGDYKTDFDIQMVAEDGRVLYVINGMSVDFGVAPKVVTTVSDFKDALEGVTPEIVIDGTIGSNEEYTVFEVNRPVTIKGLGTRSTEESKVYGTFIIKSDGVTISGLEIENRGDRKIDENTTESTKNRGGIYVFAEEVSIISNTFTNGLADNPGLSNAVQLMSSKADNPLSNYKVTGNTFIGHDNNVPNWTSSAIVIAENYTPGSIGKYVQPIKAGQVDYDALINNNTFINNSVNLVHQDVSKPVNAGRNLYEVKGS